MSRGTHTLNIMQNSNYSPDEEGESDEFHFLIILHYTHWAFHFEMDKFEVFFVSFLFVEY